MISEIAVLLAGSGSYVAAWVLIRRWIQKGVGERTGMLSSPLFYVLSVPFILLAFYMESLVGPNHSGAGSLL
jgi:hypothetical protein